MKPILKHIESTDVESLEDFSNERGPYCFSLTLHIGVENSLGNDLFNTQIMNLSWMEENLNDGIFTVERSIIMNDFNYDLLLSYINERLQLISAKNWKEVALKVNEFAKWEFYNYDN